MTQITDNNDVEAHYEAHLDRSVAALFESLPSPTLEDMGITDLQV